MSNAHTPTTNEEHFVEGLQGEVHIRVDRWGVPHIYAGNRNDVYLAQGFNAARDRLFQIDLWRRRGLGLLSEALGAAYVEQDRANRLMLYRGDQEKDWEAYGPGVKEAAESFVLGVNAYIDWALEDPIRLPPEFIIYEYEPAKWQASDTVKFRTHGLFYNVEQEVARARTLHLGGSVAEELRQAREPADPLQFVDGIDLSMFGPDTLRTYQLAFAPVSFNEALDPDSARENISGSNNWVVAGSRTTTGRPILANDPHRAITLPSLRYLAHLNTPDLDVIGAGEPGLPGISIGHNSDVAFGLTIWPADVEDLYVYQLDAADPEKYFGPAGSTKFETVVESIPVLGEAPVRVTLQYTCHGPVIHVDAEKGIAIAVRAVWLEPGMAPYMASIGYSDAQNGDDFLAALERWGAPSVNQVFATSTGDWGWQVAAKIPQREGWDGSLPVPGDGRYEWSGFATAGSLPSERQPERGWAATANEENLPKGWDNAARTATYDWYSYARAARLIEWLTHDDAVSVSRSSDMQMDTKSVHALEILRKFEGSDLDEEIASAELKALLVWDGFELPESREALIFQVWVRRHLRPCLVTERLRDAGLGEAELKKAATLVMKDESFGGDLRGDLRLVDWLLHERNKKEVAEILTNTLNATLAEILELLGEETQHQPWQWGRLHHTSVTHAAFAPLSDVDPAWATLGPLPQGGSGDTVGMAGYDGSFRQSIGATFRMVVDVGDWDESRALNSPGQSADPRSPHYSDLFTPWVSGDTFPFVFSKEAVDRETVHSIFLRPTATD